MTFPLTKSSQGSQRQTFTESLYRRNHTNPDIESIQSRTVVLTSLLHVDAGSFVKLGRYLQHLSEQRKLTPEEVERTRPLLEWAVVIRRIAHTAIPSSDAMSPCIFSNAACVYPLHRPFLEKLFLSLVEPISTINLRFDSLHARDQLLLSAYTIEKPLINDEKACRTLIEIQRASTSLQSQKLKFIKSVSPLQSWRSHFDIIHILLERNSQDRVEQILQEPEMISASWKDRARSLQALCAGLLEESQIEYGLANACKNILKDFPNETAKVGQGFEPCLVSHWWNAQWFHVLLAEQQLELISCFERCESQVKHCTGQWYRRTVRHPSQWFKANQEIFEEFRVLREKLARLSMPEYLEPSEEAWQPFCLSINQMFDRHLGLVKLRIASNELLSSVDLLVRRKGISQRLSHIALPALQLIIDSNPVFFFQDEPLEFDAYASFNPIYGHLARARELLVKTAPSRAETYKLLRTKLSDALSTFTENFGKGDSSDQCAMDWKDEGGALFIAGSALPQAFIAPG